MKGANIPKLKITDFTNIRIALALKGLQTQPGTFLTDSLSAIRQDLIKPKRFILKKNSTDQPLGIKEVLKYFHLISWPNSNIKDWKAKTKSHLVFYMFVWIIWQTVKLLANQVNFLKSFSIRFRIDDDSVL